MTDEARLRLAEGQRLLDAGDPQGATNILRELGVHPDRSIAGEAWLLIGINVVVYAIDTVLSRGSPLGGPLTEAGRMYAPEVAAGEWWRLITYAFLHAPIAGGGLGILHIGFNMYALFLFGPIMEDLYG